jgi:hypothetical protein
MLFTVVIVVVVNIIVVLARALKKYTGAHF